MSAHPTVPLVSVEEYLQNYVFRAEKPALEYVDGALLRKPMPRIAHSTVQGNITGYLKAHYHERFRILPELHVRTEEARFRVPDIAVFERGKPFSGPIPGFDTPAFLCIEIKSPEDRLTQLFSKCDEYHDGGVPHCWVIDPDSRRIWEYFAEDPEPRITKDEVNAGAIRIPAQLIFEDL